MSGIQIEHRGLIPRTGVPGDGRRLFQCDCSLLALPGLLVQGSQELPGLVEAGVQSDRFSQVINGRIAVPGLVKEVTRIIVGIGMGFPLVRFKVVCQNGGGALNIALPAGTLRLGDDGMKGLGHRVEVPGTPGRFGGPGLDTWDPHARHSNEEDHPELSHHVPIQIEWSSQPRSPPACRPSCQA